MTKLEPLNMYEIRDINREIGERLTQLQPIKELVMVKSFKKGKCYGIGYNRDGDLILRNFQRLLAICTKIFGDGTNSASVINLAGATKAIRVYSGGSDTYFYLTTSQAGSRLAFGNPVSTPTPARTDYELASLVARFSPSSVVSDETNWRVTVTGSYVWVAGGTVRETGMSLVGNDSTAAAVEILIYHDAVTDVVVPAGGTVSVTYVTQL